MVGTTAYISGHGPQAADGSLAPQFGKVGSDVTLEQAYVSARLTALSILGDLRRDLDLDRIAAWGSVLGMVNSAPGAQLTSWGDRLFNGANGIKATAREATIYGGSTPPTPTTPIPSTPPPPGGCTAAYAVTGSWGTGFQGAVTVTAGQTAIRGWVVTWTWSTGQQVTNAWNAAVTSSGSTVTARSLSYNGDLAAGASASWGFTASYSGSNTAPATVTCAAA